MRLKGSQQAHYQGQEHFLLSIKKPFIPLLSGFKHLLLITFAHYLCPTVAKPFDVICRLTHISCFSCYTRYNVIAMLDSVVCRTAQ